MFNGKLGKTFKKSEEIMIKITIKIEASLAAWKQSKSLKRFYYTTQFFTHVTEVKKKKEWLYFTRRKAFKLIVGQSQVS